METLIQIRRGQVLYDIKWKKFLRRSFLFRYIPFVDFVLGAGSMALGNVHTNSDFDVLIGSREGRIFTTRFLCVVTFGLFGWRRKKLNHHESASDKICLNHFVTKPGFELTPPYNAYWKDLYSHLVPIFGNRKAIEQFMKANVSWVSISPHIFEDLRYRSRSSSGLKLFLEKLLVGKVGDVAESFLKRIQVRHIETGLGLEKGGYEPRIIYNDAELEFHPDTRRIEAYNEKLRNS